MNNETKDKRLHYQYLDFLCTSFLSGYDIDPFDYHYLIEALYFTDFKWIIENDEHRSLDGLTLRDDFIDYTGESPEIFSIIFNNKPCSVLEVMVALAKRGEDSIMWDPVKGDRTAEWFWVMIDSLGLIDYDDDYINNTPNGIDDIHETIRIFLNREYSPDGKGGLFTIKDCEYDLRDVELWYQMNWYFGSILGS